MSATQPPHRVFLIVDPAFGERLLALPPDEPVWIVESAANDPVSMRLREANPEANHLKGITTFEFIEDNVLEEQVASILDVIDMHHGPYSADPPYSVLVVIGCPATPRVRAALGTLGFNVLQQNGSRFTAVNSWANWETGVGSGHFSEQPA